jgi:hypothetical protein
VPPLALALPLCLVPLVGGGLPVVVRRLRGVPQIGVHWKVIGADVREQPECREPEVGGVKRVVERVPKQRERAWTVL